LCRRAGVRDVGALIRTASADGVAVLLSSHQIGELEDVCDSFAKLRTGRVVWDGTAAELHAQARARGRPVSAAPRAGAASVSSVFRTERRKLPAQLSTRVLALIVLVGPLMAAA
jgi:ABC-type multidrug transport system ATPase subunit